MGDRKIPFLFMDFRDHQEFVLDEWRGLYARDDTNTPLGYLDTATDIDFRQGGIGTRRPFFDTGLPGATTGRTDQFQEFVRSIGTQRFLRFDKTTRNLYDTGSATPTVPIDTAPVGTTGFSLICLYDRAYIAYHDYTSGISGSNLKVYYEYPVGSGTWTFRDALGAAPAVGTLTAVNSATAGVIEAGTHLFKVAYETDTGFITPPCTAISYVATGGFSCDLTNIPIGPAGTVARHILVTKAIATYSGNPDEYEFFFLTRIGNNTRVELSTAIPPVVNFYDSQLTASADYLNDLIDVVKAPMGMCTYGGRVAYWGFYPSDYFPPGGAPVVGVDFGMFFVSNVNDPETISLAENLNKVSAADGGSRNIYCMAEYRGSLYIFKRGKTYATRDNGTSVPSAWPIDLVDSGFGCEALFGVARLESGQLGIHEETLFVANYNGIYAFQGSWAVKPLSWVIEATWRNIPENLFLYTRLVVQPVEQRIYSTYPFQSGGTGEQLLVCDYRNGITWDNVRWLNIFSSYNEFACIQTESILSNSGNSAGLLVSWPTAAGIARLTDTIGFNDNNALGNVPIAAMAAVNASMFNDAYKFNPNGTYVHITGVRMTLNTGNPINFQITTINDLTGAGTLTTLNPATPGQVLYTALLNLNTNAFGYNINSGGASDINWLVGRIIFYWQPLIEELPL